MGISGLLPMLKSIQRPCNLKKFSGFTLGVDAYVWLHRGAVPCAVDIALRRPTTKFVDFAMHRVRMLIHFGITPYIVFDGDYLPSKAGVEKERAERRGNSKRQGLASYRKGDMAQAHAELQKAVDITPEMAGQFIAELQKQNVKYVVAPYEADAQLAYLERKGLIQGVISEDSDLLVYGCKRLLTKLDQYGDCIEINREQFTACKSVSLVGWTDVEFRRMAILSGCDYLDNINGLGLKTAYRLLRKFKTIERVVQMLQFDSKYSVPAEYLEDFEKAELTFLHQWVFCPIDQKLVMNTEPRNGDKADLTFLGSEIDPAVARGVAYGRLHPSTKEPLKVLPVQSSGRQSSWTSARPSQPATPLDAKIGKPIETFFKSRRVPLAELDPNSFTPSPSQQRLQQTTNRTWSSSPVATPPQLPTPSNAVPTTAEANHIRRPSRSFHSVSKSSKRQRLCVDDYTDDAIAAEDGISLKSKFFSAEPNSLPRLTGLGRNKSKKDSVNIWSDDSIDGILSDMPDVSQPSRAKISIFADAKSTPKARVDASFKTETSILTVSSESSTQTAGTSSSFNDQASTRSKASLFAQFSYDKAEAEHQDGKVERSASAVLTSHESVQISHIAVVGKAENLPQEALTAERPGTKLNQLDPPQCDTVPDSPICEATEDGPKVLESPTRDVAATDGKHQTSMAAGSEDYLVPQSDDDAVEEASATPKKLNLDRFRFLG